MSALLSKERLVWGVKAKRAWGQVREESLSVLVGAGGGGVFW
ncbi:hypothetical protein ACOWKN_00160 [Helicobacter pylori]